MVNSNNAIVYSEVYGILNILDIKYKEAIPEKLYSFIEANRSQSYNPSYDKNLPLNKQNISSKAAAFICLLHYNYWCETEQEKERINIVLNHNQQKKRDRYFEYEQRFNQQKEQKFEEEIEQQELNEKGNDFLTNNVSTNNALMPQQENGWFSRFIKFIKGIFKRH
ncbi:MAG: hypothetical protein IKF38_06945 [Clostridia bacterium]|nr:hypothetical protein [Clostridia bacterium]